MATAASNSRWVKLMLAMSAAHRLDGVVPPTPVRWVHVVTACVGLKRLWLFNTGAAGHDGLHSPSSDYWCPPVTGAKPGVLARPCAAWRAT